MIRLKRKTDIRKETVAPGQAAFSQERINAIRDSFGAIVDHEQRLKFRLDDNDRFFQPRLRLDFGDTGRNLFNMICANPSTNADYEMIAAAQKTVMANGGSKPDARLKRIAKNLALGMGVAAIALAKIGISVAEFALQKISEMGEGMLQFALKGAVVVATGFAVLAAIQKLLEHGIGMGRKLRNDAELEHLNDVLAAATEFRAAFSKAVKEMEASG